MKFSYSFVLFFFVFITNVKESIEKECDDDEDCIPIEDCPALLEMWSNVGLRVALSKKYCGLMRGSTDHCCKITEEIATTEKINTSTTTATEEVTDYDTDPENPIETHKNFNLINKKCGKVSNDRIIGGEVAALNEFPWLALLEYESTEIKKDFRCSGTLISKRYVLTAAHCAPRRNEKLISVRLGEHTISNDTETKIEDIEVEKIIIHQDYNRYSKENDIALIRLKRDVEFNKSKKNIKTICLPVEDAQNIDNQNGDGLHLTIAGWGYISENSKMSDVLMKATVSYLPHDICSDEFNNLKNQHRNLRGYNIHETQLCAKGIGKIDTCRGDSGGGIIGLAENEKGDAMYQHGIVSYGIACGSMEHEESFPGIYTRVSKYAKWILDNMTA